MIEIRQVSDFEQNDWDEYVGSSPKTTPYHRYAWGKAVESSYGFKKFYIGAFNKGQLIGVMPLIRMGVPFRKKTFVSLPYCDGAGAVADTPEALDALLSYAKKQMVKFPQEPIELRYAETTTVESEKLVDGQKVRMLLPLSASPDEQMANFKSKLRSQIRKAKKNGLTSKVISFDDTNNFKTNVDEFYDVIAGNMRLLGSPVHSKLWFMSVLRQYTNNAFLVLVYKEDIAVGAGIVLLNNKTASIPWASTNSKYNKLAPNMLMYWTVLSHSITKGVEIFDFGRSTVNEGTYNFKKQWGCQPAALNWVRYNKNSVISVVDKSKSKTRILFESIWRQMPLCLVNFVGPKIRRYVSL